MTVRSYSLHGVRVAELAAEGAPLRTGRDVVDVLGATSEHEPELVVIPTARLEDDFFRLRTGIAGDVIQKFLTYRLRLVILGDISRHLRDSSALGDFVYECNSGTHVWFVPNADELNRRLQPPTASH